MRILIAEDERITRASLVRQLEAWGHEVTAVEDGEQAWETFQAAAFDIVITDWEMPRLSGVGLIQRIRQSATANVNAAYVYIMLLTSRSDKGDIVNGIEAGADDYLSKPFDREELRVRLLAGERVVRLERTLTEQNVELREASERMRADLEAAARVQRAMLPREAVRTPRVETAFEYVPTDELAGDALGLYLLDDRYLVAYVVDVTGHGVPAALLAVTVMHGLSPTVTGPELLEQSENESRDGKTGPSYFLAELNRRLSVSDNDGRFLTMILTMLDTHTGRMRFARAGHPLPIIASGGKVLEVSDEGGLPIGIATGAEYDNVEMQLSAGDRIYLYSDGFEEQFNPDVSAQFGSGRLQSMLLDAGHVPLANVGKAAVDGLAAWAGSRRFKDDVSIVAVEWLG